MLVRNEGAFPYGYSGITEVGGRYSETLMDFGILRLRAGESYTSSGGRERALLLLSGTLDITWDGRTARASRGSFFDEAPWCLSLAAGSDAVLTAVGGNKRKAAEMLRVSLKTVYNKIKQYELER